MVLDIVFVAEATFIIVAQLGRGPRVGLLKAGDALELQLTSILLKVDDGALVVAIRR